MEEKLRGIVLSGVPYGEGDKILNIFTLEKGVISAKIKGVKKAGAKLKFAAEPFCFAEFIITTQAERRTVINASLIDSFYPIREDIKKFFSAGTVLEFLRRFFKEEMVAEDMFILSTDALKELAYGNKDTQSVLVKFLLDGLKEIGYGLNLSSCCKCSSKLSGRIFFDYSSGGFICEQCFDGTGREINLATYIALKSIDEGEESPFVANKALKLLEYYIVNKTDENLKSLNELIKL